MGYQETDEERIEERIRPIKERMTITAVHRNGKMGSNHARLNLFFKLDLKAV